MDYSSFLDFLSTTAIDMTKKIADLELHPAHHRMQEWEASDVASFSIRTSGGFRISLVLCAQRELLREIARRMKRQDKVTSGDVEIYSGEYFNIVCGTFLSHVNNTLFYGRFLSGEVFGHQHLGYPAFRMPVRSHGIKDPRPGSGKRLVIFDSLSIAIKNKE